MMFCATAKGLKHLLASLRECSVVNGVDFDEELREVDALLLAGEFSSPAATRDLRAKRAEQEQGERERWEQRALQRAPRG